MDICLRGGRVIDPARGMDADADVLLKDGVVARVGAGLAGGQPAGVRIVDARGCWVVPGLIDLHTHLREPGQEYKEDIATGTRAAAAGGYTAVCAMPNTVPPNDNRAVSELMVRRAAEVGVVRVYPVGAISKGLMGESLAEMGELRDAGCVAVSDDGHSVMNAELMRRAMEYARTFGLPVVQHCEDLTLSAGGAMNEGIVSTRAGIRAQPSAAESAMVARDIELCALTGARYHVAHISSAESVRLVREAKRRGLPVTCEVTPHHLMLTDEACATYDTHAKCNPPLRAVSDVEALRVALVEGVIDAVATDHAPHSAVEKDVEFEQAAFGVIGLETAVALVLELVRTAGLSPADFVRRMTTGPAAAFGLRGGTLAEGRLADVTVIDPEAAWTCVPAGLRSRSRNTPFAGRPMRGRATLTVVGGRIVYSGERLS
ncbi:MAG TPA: dihydroorotase [Polyangia bacterium]|jgi:dihydroorotase|nr:dihydroorotase [Polyangia bacterium]